MGKNVQKLNELQGPHYDIPERSHHFSEIYRSIGDLKEMNAPVYDIDYKHTYKPNENINPDLRELVGPNYHVNTKHSYGHDFAKDTLSKESHGPIFKVERKHGYGADFSVRHRTASPCAGPVLNVERKHHYKAPLTQPHQRDLRAKSATPTYEVNKSHHYQGSQTHKSDLSSMVGPVYNTGKLTKHNFTGGYVAPKARADQVELVSKFFKGEQTQQIETRTETHQSQKIEQIESKATKVEFAGGEERRKEALERRQEFLKQQEDLHMKITSSSQYSMSNAKTRQQLEEEREAYIQNAVKRVQEEALMLSNRAKEEEMKRLEYIRLEEERIKREDALRAEAMARAEEERRQKEIARQEELRRHQELMRKQREELEQERLLKRRQEEEERQRLEKLRLAEERKMAKVEKVEMTKKSEESNHLAELKRQEELKMLERQRLEQMILQESKLVKCQVAKRSDDVHGLGWGNVTTGFVSKKKLGFLQREMSMERDSHEGSPAPGVFGSRTRGLRVTFAESPGGSRPGSGAGWTERVAEMDSQSMRAQTPPLAGEWAVSKGSKSISNGSSSLVQTQGSREMQSSSFQSNGSSSMQSSQMSSSMSSSKQVSSFQSSSFSSAQKSSFSSSQSSSFQSSSIQASSAFEAFPGMGGIENLKLEGSEN